MRNMRINVVDIKNGNNNDTYRYRIPVRFPIESGMVPLNRLEYKKLKARLITEKIMMKFEKNVRINWQ